MKSTPKNQRDALRAQYEEAPYDRFSVQYAGYSFDCYVLPAEKVPAELPLGIMQLTPDRMEWTKLQYDPKQVFFAISSNVPKEFREFWVLHEAIEYLHSGTSDRCDCELATSMEIGIVFASRLFTYQKQLYVGLRTQFFRELVAFATARDYPAEDIHQFEHSLSLLLKTAARFGIKA